MTIENGRITEQQITLPERYEELTVASMLPGETTYTTPWSMWFDQDGKGWVTGESRLHEIPGGTVEMWLARLNAGFVADISSLREQWRRQYTPSGVGTNAESSIAVIGLITNHKERKIVEAYLREIS